MGLLNTLHPDGAVRRRALHGGPQRQEDDRRVLAERRRDVDRRQEELQRSSLLAQESRLQASLTCLCFLCEHVTLYALLSLFKGTLV